MFSLEIIKRINASEQRPTPHYELRFYPRIVALTRIVNQLPVDKEYRRWLRHSLWLYADQIIERIEPPRDEGWDDIEALQQVALGDWNEAMLHAMINRYNLGERNGISWSRKSSRFLPESSFRALADQLRAAGSGEAHPADRPPWCYWLGQLGL